jgi:ectoine hydroxylase-related dioxygenase (phytanoyl-CoA dioxygenase family)
MTTAIHEPPLSREDILAYRDRGYLGPITVCSPDEMAIIRGRIEREVLPTTGPNPANPTQCRHLDRRVIHDLVTHPAVIARVVPLLGSDLMCWSSNFWVKEPGADEIPWHQDSRYWPLEPMLNLTAWIAIDAADEDNSCVRVIPGSHRRDYAETVDGRAGWRSRVDPALFDESQAVPMALAPGQCFLFNERLLHQSNPNRSSRRRIGLAVRLTTTWVHLRRHEHQNSFPEHSNLLVHGEDRVGINRIHTTAPPA